MSGEPVNSQVTPAAAPGRRRVAGRDGVWLQDSPNNLMVINAVLTTDRLDVETLRQLWTERVLEADGGERYPRFGRRLVWEGRKAFWQDDPGFDVANHVVIADDPSVRSRDELQEYVGRLASRPLPPDRPLWQMLLIPDFDDDGSAAIFRIHHCMGDGIGLLPILFSLMDATPEGNGMVFPAVVDRGGKPPNKLAMGLRATLAGPAILGQKFLWRPDRSSLHGQPLSGDKRVGWTDAIDVGLIKEIKNRLGTTVNDVLVACVAGAFQRYATEHPGERLEQLRVSMPVNVRSRADMLKMENKFAAVLLPLPVTEEDPKERIHATKRRMDALKRSSEPIFTYGVVSLLLRTLPPRWSRGIINYLANKCTCVLSNVPGPREPVFLAGRRLRSMLFWVPQRADIGIGVSILSFAGSLRLGVIADAALIEDPTALTRAFEDELHGIRNALDLGGPQSAVQPSSEEAAAAAAG